MNSVDGANEGRAIGVARVVGPAVGPAAVGTAAVGRARVSDGGSSVLTRPAVRNWVIGVMAAAAVAVGAAVSNAFDTDPGLSLVGQNSDSKSSLRVVGLTADQRLVGFDTDRPQSVRGIGKVRGLTGDGRLIGIDYRVQDGKLYGVGDQGGVYTLSDANAKATKVSQLTVALSGQAFGVDFNPAADRLRIVSDTGQNLRHNVNAGGTTIADTMLTYPPATAAATGVAAAAYTNNDLNADTATALYDIDTALDQVALQAPANSGQLSPIGKLGVDTGTVAGFDIYTTLKSGKAVDATGYATLTVAGKSAFYRVSLITGKADRLGSFPKSAQVTDLALPLGQ
jgi:hypothetical protein